MQYKVAILLATYNGEAYILEQIQTILNQKNVNITIFVSDDDSSDETLNTIEALEKKNIKILPKAERFGSASQNFFRLFKDVDFSEFDYVALADQDDLWEENKISHAISAIQENKLDGYASNVTAFWEDGKRQLIDKSAPEVEWDYLFGSAGPGCTIVLTPDVAEGFKKELMSKEELCSQIDLHDWLIYAYVRANGMKWWVDSWSSMKYRQHANNEFGANSGLNTFLSRWNKARNGWYSSQILSLAQFCNQTNVEPIKYLKTNSYIDKIRLAKMAFKLRKRKSEAFVLSLMLLVPGFKI